MEKDRSSKIIAIVALAVAVLGVSLGFAAYSQDLTIEPAAVVKGDASKFDVQFSTSKSGLSTGTVEADLQPKSVPEFTATSANLIATTVSDISASFQTGKGEQVATYTFYVINNGEYDAELKKVTLGKTTCTAKEGTTQSLVDAACDDVSIKIQVGSDTYVSTQNVSGGKIISKDAEEGETVIVTITYTDNGEEHLVDGDFDVDFGTITLNYSSSVGN